MLPWAPIEEVCLQSSIACISSNTGTGQAQYIRIPYADFNALKLPPGKEHESDFILLAGKFQKKL